METLKRLTCRVKGQIGVCEFLWEMRVARLAECRPEQKAGYDQHTSPHNCNPTILNILVKLKNDGKADDTIKNTDKLLRHLDAYADLNNPEAVKQFIATKSSPSYKRNLCIAYNKYCQYCKIKWEMPFYKRQS